MYFKVLLYTVAVLKVMFKVVVAVDWLAFAVFYFKWVVYPFKLLCRTYRPQVGRFCWFYGKVCFVCGGDGVGCVMGVWFVL